SFVHVDSLDLDSSWRKWTAQNSPLPIGSAYKLSMNQDTLIIGTTNRVYKRSLEPFSSFWQVLDQNSGIINHMISSVCIDHFANIWISYGGWNEDKLAYDMAIDTLLTRIDSSGNVRHWSKGEAGLHDKVISKIVAFGGSINLASWGHGTYFKMGEDWINYLPNSIGFPKITDLKTDANNAIWLGNGVIGTSPVRKSTLGVSKFRDGEWTTYNMANSPIITDNILSVAVDSRNRKWFGTWDRTLNNPMGWDNGITIFDDDNGIWKKLRTDGIKTWNEDTQRWIAEPGSVTLLSNTIGAIIKDTDNNMLVGCYDLGVKIIGPSDEDRGSFTIPNSVYQRILFLYH
ncbi:MAG: hypothetical protein U1C33_04820, partial [Candidatus Cloacimonadaceae bacterium]|nr:hypothetical protein [Candidatus Cloacimonadaceae bacterium]